MGSPFVPSPPGLIHRPTSLPVPLMMFPKCTFSTSSTVALCWLVGPSNVKGKWRSYVVILICNINVALCPLPIPLPQDFWGLLHSTSPIAGSKPRNRWLRCLLHSGKRKRESSRLRKQEIMAHNRSTRLEVLLSQAGERSPGSSAHICRGFCLLQEFIFTHCFPSNRLDPGQMGSGAARLTSMLTACREMQREGFIPSPSPPLVCI